MFLCTIQLEGCVTREERWILPLQPPVPWFRHSCPFPYWCCLSGAGWGWTTWPGATVLSCSTVTATETVSCPVLCSVNTAFILRDFHRNGSTKSIINRKNSSTHTELFHIVNQTESYKLLMVLLNTHLQNMFLLKCIDVNNTNEGQNCMLG